MRERVLGEFTHAANVHSNPFFDYQELSKYW